MLLNVNSLPFVSYMNFGVFTEREEYEASF
jgi:hypothetical protein